MLLRKLELIDFRSYERARLDLEPGSTLLVGPNAQGKTNLIEAVHRAATGTSHRVANDTPLVRAGAPRAVIRTEMLTDMGRRRTVDIELSTGGRNRVRVDGHDVRRAAEAAGALRVVLFAPEDLAIVRGDPTDRRRFLDTILSQRRPAFAAARAGYERALRQRNQLLRQARSLTGSARDGAAATVDAWTQQLVTHGAQVVAARLAALAAVRGELDRIYRELADRPEQVGLGYRSALALPDPDEPLPGSAAVAVAFHDALAEAQAEEWQRGMTLVGPHRDDLIITIGTLNARGYSSHGEAWTLALALRLATVELLTEVGDRPVLLLDDVFAELDATRRARLSEACEAFEQVLVTAAVEEDVPLVGRRIDVRMDEGRSRLSPRVGDGGVVP